MMPLCDTIKLSTDAIEINQPPCRLHIRVWQRSLKIKPDSLENAALCHSVVRRFSQAILKKQSSMLWSY
ncbi:hypothetical protein TNCV_3118761 [Trichonephila clavipes]|uniref:Uncharacterized protein n=1 Tax=Trichonephila clavipes TaxID=2585209 RepID=A0A8X6WAR6_TRICX|nr:hypothetical protein TNCV_3118761 [Trichonephila clavipes]